MAKKITPEEKELVESFEQDEWQSVKELDKERRRYQNYADATFKKDRRINIRLSEKDLLALQKRALEEGIPYQTLISSLLHKYVSDRLVEKERKKSA